MKSRRFLLLSMALNLVLLATICHLALRRIESKPVLREVRIAPATEPAAVVVVETNSDPVLTDPGVEAFSWAQLVSPDFKVYRDRLRAIQCPDDTVRDIIIAEINEKFRPRRAEIVASAQGRYWEITVKGKKAFEEVEATLDKLDEEHQALIEEVLGKETEDEESMRDGRTRYWGAYAWLPAEKQRSLIELELEYQKRNQTIWNEVVKRADNAPTDDDHQKIKTLEDELAFARQRLMSPEEYLEYRRRNSPAGSWARSLGGFEATETEWRAVAQLKLEYEDALQEAFPSAAEMDETFARRYRAWIPNGSQGVAQEDVRRKMQAELNAAIKSALGTERFTEYQLASNSDYQQTKRIIDRYELPESLAKQAYELQRAAAAHVEALGADANLTSEARLSALAAIRKETERALATTLGPKVFSTYQEYHGGWLKGLDQ